MPEKLNWVVAIVSISAAVFPFTSGFLIQQIRFFIKNPSNGNSPTVVLVRLDKIEKDIGEVREEQVAQGKKISEMNGYLKGKKEGG